MPILPPHNPEVHDRQEPQGAGVGWWAKESVKIAALVALHGDVLNGPEAAAHLGVTRGRVLQLGLEGTIRRFPIGRHVFYLVKDLDAWGKLRSEGKVRRGPGRISPVFS